MDVAELRKELAKLSRSFGQTEEHFDLALVRVFQALFGGSVLLIAAWLQSSYSVGASAAQIAMRSDMLIALGIAIGGILATPTMTYLSGVGNRAADWSRLQMSHFDAVVLAGDSSGRDFEAERLRLDPWYTTISKNVNKRAGKSIIELRRLKYIWIAGFLLMHVAFFAEAIYIFKALAAAEAAAAA